MVVEGPEVALADAVVVLEARPVAVALEVAEEPEAAVHLAESAALVVVPMGCPAAAGPRVVVEPTVRLDHQRPKDVRLNFSPSADDPEDLQAAVPASVFHESEMPEAQTASGAVLWTRVEHRSSPILQ